MAKPELEQLKKALEQTAPASETEQPGNASQPDVQTSPEASQQEDETVDVGKRVAEAKAEAWRSWQSKYDSLASEVQTLRQEIKKGQRAKTQAEEDSRLDAEFSRFIEDGEDETKVRTLREKAKEIRAKAAAHNEAVEAHNETVTAFAESRNTVNATRAILSKLIPSYAALMNEAVPYLVKLSKGDADVMEALADVAIGKFKTKAEETTETNQPAMPAPSRRPDAGFHSTPSNTRIDDLSAMEKVKVGLARTKRK